MAAAAAAAAAALATNPNNVLFNAASNGKIMKLKAALKAGADVNYAKPPYNQTPLIRAINAGHIKIVNHLLTVPGIDVNKQAMDGSSPLYSAVASIKREIIQRLLQVEGINVNLQTNDGSTPLLVAIHYGLAGFIDLLLAVPGIDVNAGAFSPLYKAIGSCTPAIVAKLLAAPGIDVNKLQDGVSPLYYATSHRKTSIVELLLAAPGIDVNNGKDASTPLMLAAYDGNLAIVNLLLATPGIDVNKKPTALHYAAKQGHLAVVNRLLEVPGIDLGDDVKHARSGRYKAEINKAILRAASEVPNAPKWQPATRSSVDVFEAIFETEPPATGARSTAIDTSTCPVCFAFTSRIEACNYMKHDCRNSPYYNAKLYDKFKNAEGKISWCTICGRICSGHRHYKLSDPADEKMPELTSYTAGGNVFADDCKIAGGGGLEEKFKRYRRAREVLKELDDSLTYEEAMDILVEEMWRAPRAALPTNAKLAAMRATKKYTNIPTESFPPNIAPNRILNPHEVLLGGKKYLYNSRNQVYEIKTVEEEPENWNFETYKGALAPPAIQERFRKYKIASRPVEKYIAPLDPALLPKMVTLSEPILNPITLDETDKILHFKHTSGAHVSELDVAADTQRIGIPDFFGLLKDRMYKGEIGPCWKATCGSRLHPDEVDEVVRLAEAEGGFSEAQMKEWREMAKRYRGLYIMKYGVEVSAAGATGGGQAIPVAPAGGAGFGRRTRRNRRF